MSDSSKVLGPDGQANFKMPPCHRMKQEIDLYEKMCKENRADPQALKKQYALVKIYRNFVNRVNEHNIHLNGMSSKKLGSEVQNLRDMMADVEADRADERLVEVLTKKIDQIYACFKMVEACNEMESALNALREQEEEKVEKGGRLVD